MQHNTPALDHAVTAALERLAETEARAARQARTRGDAKEAAYFQRACTSYTNALIEYSQCVRPQQLPSGAWLLPSRRPGEPPHIIRMDGDWICDCRAGSMAHWPIGLIIGLEVAQDYLDQLDGGEAETSPPPPPTPILTLPSVVVTQPITTPADVGPALGRLSPAARMGQRLALAAMARARYL